VPQTDSIVRRLIPRFVLAFLTIGVLRWTGEWAGLYPNIVGVAIATTSGIAVTIGLVVWAGRQLEHMEERLRQEQARFRGAFDSSAIGMALVSPEGRFLEVNRSLCELVGYGEEELVGCTFQEITHPDDLDADLAFVHRVLAGEIPSYRMEKRYIHRDGRVVWILLSVSLARDAAGRPLHFVSQIEDVTDRKRAEADRSRLETELRHAQKLDAIGRLAGGVAHDFNNILTAVTGYSELLLERLEPGGELHGHAEEIRRSAAQAGSLTRQLLAFGRKQFLQPAAIDPNEVVADAEGLLRSLIGERYSLRVECEAGLGTVLADAGQVEHVIVNLVLNARDAMPGGGEIRVLTRNALVGADGIDGLAPGRYGVISVTDTGVGMDAETKARLFEPFFTTKPVGKGSGLGLSTAYGVATQSGGTIVVSSEPGRGSTVSLYQPRTHGLRAVDEPEQAAAPSPRRATVLVAEDREVVRTLVVTVLEREGLHVLAAANGAEALAASEAHDGPIDLLLTDVVMPGLNGDELATRLWVQRPDTPVLLMSGYTELDSIRRGAADGELPFIEKPFSPRELVDKVSAVLGGDPQLRAVG
jgi:PAS domain S-box-containing protein